MSVAIAGYLLGSLVLLALFMAQLKLWNKGISSFMLLAATLVTLAWCLALLFQTAFPPTAFYLIQALEILRNAAWFALLLSILGLRKVLFDPGERRTNEGLLLIALVTAGIPGALLVYMLYANLSGTRYFLYPESGGPAVLSGFLLTAITGLVLLEQVLRNTRHYQRWHLKFLCLGLGLLFSFDLYMYSDAILFGRVRDPFWESRGFVVSLAAPLIAISVLRTSKQPIQVNISRKLVFHTGVLLAAGIYLLLMASAGFYIRANAGEWGPVLQALFWLVSLCVLLTLMFSGRVRTLIKFYISRNLFSSRYDYREEWLRLTRALSVTSSDESLPHRAIHAMADIVDSPGGALWLTSDGKYFDQAAEVEMGWVENGTLAADHPLIRFFEERNWLLNLDEVGDGEGVGYSGEPPAWPRELKDPWLLVPLALNERLIGFMALRHSRVRMDLNWEDYDLLKTAAGQTASYLAQMMATEALSQARQFSAFNQMSAFVVHDIKTVNSQLSLMVSNAARHRTNPSFIEDMIKMAEHAVEKMHLLLQHLKSDAATGGLSRESAVNLVQLLHQIADSRRHAKPAPRVAAGEMDIMVKANEQELKSAIGQLVKNAQEATGEEGSVDLTVEAGEDRAILRIKDTGGGMTQEFINTRLFRPFESTKGLTGMGVGVYQSRETVRKLGGDLRVTSRPGQGTEFTLTLERVKAGVAMEEK